MLHSCGSERRGEYERAFAEQMEICWNYEERRDRTWLVIPCPEEKESRELERIACLGKKVLICLVELSLKWGIIYKGTLWPNPKNLFRNWTLRKTLHSGKFKCFVFTKTGKG